MRFRVKTKLVHCCEIEVEAKDEARAKLFANRLSVEEVLDHMRAYAYQGPRETEMEQVMDTRDKTRMPLFIDDEGQVL